MTVTTETAEKRRKALIAAALGEIADRGSLDVTVAQIAARAEVSSALAHHYFGTKEDLMLATMLHLLGEFRGDVMARIRAAQSPRERLSAIVEGSFGPDQFDRSTIGAWLAFYAWALGSPRAARLLTLYQRRLHSNMLHALKRLVSPAEAERIATGLGGLIDGVYLREALSSRATAPDVAIALVEDYIDRRLPSAAARIVR